MKRRIIKLMTTCFAVAFVFLPSTQILAKSNDPLDIIRIQIAEDAKNKTKEKLT